MNVFRKIVNWYFTKRAVPYWCVLLLDCVIVLFSGLMGSYIEFGGAHLTSVWWETVLGIVCCLPVYVVCFHAFHTYQGIIRYSSYMDLFRLSKATAIASATVGTLGYFVHSNAIVFPDLNQSLSSSVLALS